MKSAETKNPNRQDGRWVIDIYVTLCGNILTYYAHNQVAQRTFKSIKSCNDWVKHNDYVIGKVCWAQPAP